MSRKVAAQAVTSFQTRRLRRDLLAQLHIIKAKRNAERVDPACPAWRLDEVLNEVIERGLRHTAV